MSLFNKKKNDNNLPIKRKDTYHDFVCLLRESIYVIVSFINEIVTHLVDSQNKSKEKGD